MQLIFPNWSAKNNIKALTTTRIGGVSLPPYDSLNLASHVGDDNKAVQHNRQLLRLFAQLPAEPFWLNQVHNNQVVNINTLLSNTDGGYDASYTSRTGKVCAVLTADCLPVLFYSKLGNEVAAAHAGWRGLCRGVLENTVKQFCCHASSIVAWLGPAIGASQFEVGVSVKQQFELFSVEARSAFQSIDGKSGRYLADIYMLARQRLHAAGVIEIHGGDYCTMSDVKRFFSYRRQHITGRMASLIWIDKS